MRFNDASRPYLANGRPCWLGSLIVLPTIELIPRAEAGAWKLRLMCGGIWAEKEVQSGAIMALLKFWGEDPEAFLMAEFDREAPKGIGPNRMAEGSRVLTEIQKTNVVEQSAEELEF